MPDSFNGWRRKEKVVVVMGATGTGKSRLSIDLANWFPAEIVNSDKMQVYHGLDVVTNKVTEEEQCGIPHHLLGIVDPDSDFTGSDFRHLASLAVGSIVARDRLPIIVGGSNSYIEALVDDEELEFRSKYECCFLWVDVSLPVLHSFVSDRVDHMIEAGLIDEVRNIFDPEGDYNQGIRRAIGVPEMDRFLRAEAIGADYQTRAKLLDEAINEIKANNCRLACRQLQKIQRLRTLSGWNIHRLDATDAFLKRGRESDEAWKNLVAGPSSMIVRRFLYDDEHLTASINSGPTIVSSALSTAVMGSAVAAASR
ncbi:tRNA isopentenyltransferase [Macleaya cordata]|uniref:adenylate dimethylallyltransferase (ADP/ATP-dependent) n=1 Tax=Macleaya cordata TaxID=56857 RepID=A0A200PXP8_MACCD|nr:tRNA isopentenyltransferase [Macleaya cordata]